MISSLFRAIAGVLFFLEGLVDASFTVSMREQRVKVGYGILLEINKLSGTRINASVREEAETVKYAILSRGVENVHDGGWG